MLRLRLKNLALEYHMLYHSIWIVESSRKPVPVLETGLEPVLDSVWLSSLYYMVSYGLESMNWNMKFQ